MTRTPDHAFGGAAAAAQARARALGRPVVLSYTLAIPPAEDLLALPAGPGGDGHAFFWQCPADDVAVAADGAALVLAGEGPRRFETIRAACAAVRQDAVTAGAPACGPLFVGGFAFAPGVPDGPWAGWPSARLIVPRRQVVQRGARATLTFNVLVDGNVPGCAVDDQLRAELAAIECGTAAPLDAPAAPAEPVRYLASAEPAPPEWAAAVAATVRDIGAGRLEKLVLARSCTVEATTGFDCRRVVRRLRRAYPGCTTFWIASPEGDFLGATPEPLVQVTGDRLETAAIAGSAARGTTPAADRALAEALLASAKERHEHALVVRAVVEALTPACASLDVAAVPDVLQLATVQHLMTPIRGRLAHAAPLLDLVARLHPTPAVGGVPRDVALGLLARREMLERGWYGGPVGWTDGAGDGAFAVALRCALVRGARAVLFAGAGIVAGSDPEAEIAETRVKFQPLLAALMEI